MFHLAPIGTVHEGPGMQGRAIAIINVPTATLCGIGAANGGALNGERIVMPHDHPQSCRDCLKLLPQRRSLVVPMMLPG